MEESEGIFWLHFSFLLSFLAQIRYIKGYGVNFFLLPQNYQCGSELKTILRTLPITDQNWEKRRHILSQFAKT